MNLCSQHSSRLSLSLSLLSCRTPATIGYKVCGRMGDYGVSSTAVDLQANVYDKFLHSFKQIITSQGRRLLVTNMELPGSIYYNVNRKIIEHILKNFSVRMTTYIYTYIT
jgi:hypothetical protein